MAKKKEPEVVEVTRAELEALAKEMNDVMGLDPAIKFNRKTTDEALIEMIKAESVDPDSGEPCIYDTDFQEDPEDEEKVVFSEDAEKTLEALGIEIAEEEDGDELADLDMDGLKSYIKKNDLDIKVTKKMDEDAVRDLIREAQTKEEPEPEEELEPEKPAKGAKGKAAKEEKAPAKSEKAPAKKDEKAAKAPAAKKEKSEKFTRYMSVAAVLKEGKALSEDDLIKKADDLYSKKGGNSGIDQSARIVDRSMQLLNALGMVEVKSGKIKYLGE